MPGSTFVEIRPEEQAAMLAALGHAVRLAHLRTVYGNGSMTTLPPSTTCMCRS